MPRELIRKVKRLDLSTKRKVNGLIQGSYHSVFKGRGIEYSESRKYELGDDVKRIDWNLTAKHADVFVKEFIEERNLNVYIAVDISGSSLFGYEESKQDKSNELAATLIYSAIKNNDKAGLFLFTDDVELYLPAKGGKNQFLRILRELVTFKPKHKTTCLNKSLEKISKIVRKKSIIFIISDFDDSGYETALKLLKKKHDVVALKIDDIREHVLPELGYIELEDEENGETYVVDTSDKTFQESYKKQIRLEQKKIKKIFDKLNIDCITITTSKDFYTQFKQFFKQRLTKINR